MIQTFFLLFARVLLLLRIINDMKEEERGLVTNDLKMVLRLLSSLLVCVRERERESAPRALVIVSGLDMISQST